MHFLYNFSTRLNAKKKLRKIRVYALITLYVVQYCILWYLSFIFIVIWFGFILWQSNYRKTYSQFSQRQYFDCHWYNSMWDVGVQCSERKYLHFFVVVEYRPKLTLIREHSQHSIQFLHIIIDYWLLLNMIIAIIWSQSIQCKHCEIHSG